MSPVKYLKIAIITVSMALITISAYCEGIGKFEISDESGNNRLRLRFAGQLKLEFISEDNGTAQRRDEGLFMEMRRLRLILEGNIIDPNLIYSMQLNFAPGAAEFMDFYFDYKFRSCLQLRVGQFKIPYTRFRMTSFSQLNFVDWPVVTKYFGAERQMGLMINNGIKKPGRLGYAAGIFSGVNARASHAIGMPLIFGEPRPNPSSLSDHAPRAKFHPEFVGQISFNQDDEADRLKWNLIISGTIDLDPAEYQDFSHRISPELMLSFDKFSLKTIIFWGLSDLINENKPARAADGFLGEIACHISKKLTFAVRYAQTRTDNDFRIAAYNRARNIIAEDGPDAARYISTGFLEREEEIALGAVYRIYDESLKLMSDIVYNKHARIDCDREDYLIRSQLQLVF